MTATPLTAGATAAARDAVLVTPQQLAAELAAATAPGGTPVVLLDVRWQLGRSDGHELYRAGHLPGAVWVDLETELAAPPTPQDGRHPLPSLAVLQAAARRWGVSDGSRVVVYDALGGMSAARAWWLLRWAGARDVRILDGGLPAWQAAGGAVTTDEVVPAAGSFTVVPGALPTLSADDAAALPGGGVLLDARAGERFRGETEPIDPRAGHIPGAVSAPTGDNLTTTGEFAASAVLAARFAGLGVTPDARVGVYCGSGVTAAHQAAALASIGITAELYPGSWSQWSSDPNRPVATGA